MWQHCNLLVPVCWPGRTWDFAESSLAVAAERHKSAYARHSDHNHLRGVILYGCQYQLSRSYSSFQTWTNVGSCLPSVFLQWKSLKDNEWSFDVNQLPHHYQPTSSKAVDSENIHRMVCTMNGLDLRLSTSTRMNFWSSNHAKTSPMNRMNSWMLWRLKF